MPSIPADPALEGAIRDLTAGIGAIGGLLHRRRCPAIRSAIPLMAKGGWLMLYGSIHPKGDLAVDPNDIHYRELNITGTFSHDKESFREAVAMLNGQTVKPAALHLGTCGLPAGGLRHAAGDGRGHLSRRPDDGLIRVTTGAPCFLGLDIGTFGVKGVVVESDGRASCACAGAGAGRARGQPAARRVVGARPRRAMVGR